eukprot:TRINITY_DN136_c0_g1_i1.p1 TRINITY_DN136_c0_g1~~TRINITY_DN136_c0_g1_i1.p1  ORF type:complete len:137 (+),score=42.20 TRINITY_DN136_c0_g1_i1:120-530(+)
MVKILKPGKVVIVTRGKFAGRKAVIVKSTDTGDKRRPYAHALIAGINKYPKTVKRAMSKKQVEKRSKLYPFLKTVNHQHLMPTRYSYQEITLKKAVPKNADRDPARKRRAIRRLKHHFSADYKSGQKRWFFSKLKF